MTLQEQLKAKLDEIEKAMASGEDVIALVEEAEAIKAKIESNTAAQERLAKLHADVSNAGQPVSGGASTKSEDNEIDRDPYAGFGEYGEGDFLRAVYEHGMSGKLDERLGKMLAAAPQNPFHTRDTGVSFPRPEGFQEGIEEYDFDSEDEIIGRYRFDSTSVGRLKYVRNELDSGLTAYWDDELDQLQESKLDYQKGSLEVNRMTVATSASNEELSDFPRLRQIFNIEAPRAMNKKLLNGVLTGDGVAKPKAYLSGGHVISQAKDSGQAADTISETNVINMYSRFINGNGAYWMINHECLPEIMSLALNGDSIWTPLNEGFKTSPGGSLLGLPVVMNDYAKRLGDLGDIVLINPRGYKGIRLAGGIKSAMSEHIYFDRYASMFIWLQWVGGEPIFENPYDPSNSTGKQGQTRSHVVDLAARA